MQCLITAGPTHEPLDRVRRITNFSTGTVGTALANHLAAAGHQALLFRSETACAERPVSAVNVESFSTTTDLASLFLKHATDEPVSIFHAAAVSDFRFGPVYQRDKAGELAPVYAGKISTREGSLWVELKPTPKILEGLREWFPHAFIVGWKYEVDGLPSEAETKARHQLQECQTNACVLNGPACGPGYTLITAQQAVHYPQSSDLFAALEKLTAGTHRPACA